MARSSARIKPPGKTQAERDAIALGRIEAYMDSLSTGILNCPTCREDYKINELSPSAVQLIRARYDKLRPSLSAVEQTTHEVSRSAGDIINEIRALLEAKPDLLATLLPGYRIVPVTSLTPDAAQQMADNAHDIGTNALTH